MKKLSISMSDFIYDSFIATIQGNRSERIETLIQKGAMVEMGDIESKHTQILNLNLKLREAEVEIKQLEAKLKRYKAIVKPTDQDLFIERLKKIRDYKICVVCSEPFTDSDITDFTPDGKIHDKCILNATPEMRAAWSEDKTFLDWSLLELELEEGE